MGTLALGISLIIGLYAIFLHVTYLYLFEKDTLKDLGLIALIKKSKTFLQTMGTCGFKKMRGHRKIKRHGTRL